MRAASGWALQRTQGGPLAVTLGVHVLLAWCWLQAARPAAPGESVAAREFLLVPLLAAPQREREPVSIPAVSEPVLRSRARPVVTPAAPQAITPPVVTDPATTAETAAQSDPDPLFTPALETPVDTAPVGDSMAARALRAAGSVEREMRKGKPVLLSDDARGPRLAAALDAARIDSARTLASESYTAPDGVTVYRFRIGNKVWCRTTGHVKPSLGGAVGGGAASFDSAGGAGAAGLITCPKHAQFKRD